MERAGSGDPRTTLAKHPPLYPLRGGESSFAKATADKPKVRGDGLGIRAECGKSG